MRGSGSPLSRFLARVVAGQFQGEAAVAVFQQLPAVLRLDAIEARPHALVGVLGDVAVLMVMIMVMIVIIVVVIVALA